ncbi:MAG: carboxypeptidase regulatory-like domain-containing protein [Candidatus Methanoperedens sp.]|nr:carboxypeptidase regulatory-like domain-containing protein [Candidatus Methanoperedens sp.]
MNSFNTSLPAGQVLVNITASSTNGNNVNFTVSTLSPGRNYIIKKGGSSFATKEADSSGRIEFSNSEWSEGTFTIQEGSSPEGSISGRLSHINETSLAGATVSLFYSSGAPYGLSTSSGADGRFRFSNIPVGTYYVKATKAKSEPNQSSAFTVVANGTADAGTMSLIHYDLDGNGVINVLDMNLIGQHFGEYTGKPYPVYGTQASRILSMM